MNCKTCNKLLGELNPTCAECIEGMRDQIDSLKKEKKDLFEDQKERIQEGNILRTENAALKAEIEEWRHSQDMSFKAVEEADKEVRKHKKALELVFSAISTDRLQEICEAEAEGRLVIPLKLGQEIYDIDADEILAYKVREYSLLSVNNKNIRYWAECVSSESEDDIDFWSDDIGKTVFLSREAAEDELKTGVE